MGKWAVLMGRYPTWKRAFGTSALLELLVPTTACNFEHYPYFPASANGGASTNCRDDASNRCGTDAALTDEAQGAGGAAGDLCPGDAGTRCEPACTVETNPSGAIPSSLAAHFTFDGDGDAWLDSDVGRYSLQVNPSDQSEQVRYGAARINGKGSSLSLDGTQFAEYVGVEEDRLFPAAQTSQADTGFTVVANFSPEPEWIEPYTGARSTHVRPIVSTMGPDSCGYQLDLRWTDGDSSPTLAFSYGFRPPEDAGQSCKINQLSYLTNLPGSGPMNAWGSGSWHWAIASYFKAKDSDLASLTLHFDGKRVANDVGQTEGAGPAIAYSNYVFYLGASGLDAQRFKGTLDEINVFDQPISGNQPWDFTGAATTTRGPSHCRWSTWESWAKTAPGPSTTTWQSDSDGDEAHIVVNDDNWGGGGLTAQLTPAKDLSLYDTVYLDATIQRDKAVQFELSNPDGNCHWLLLGTGARQHYSIDLSQPQACATRGCAFHLDQTSSLSISSEWTTNPVPSPSPVNPSRTTGLVDIIVHSVDFEVGPNKATNWSAYGGSIGPNGWCWRPVAYDLMGLASWVGDQPSVASATVSLGGLGGSSTEILADFGNQPLTLPENACVMIDASGSQTDYQSQPLSFGINDSFGSSRNWDIRFSSLSKPSRCMIQLVSPSWSNEKPHPTLFEYFPDVLDLTKIASIVIQKPFVYSTYGNPAVVVTVRGITIHPDDGQKCATYLGGAGYCNK